MLSAILSGVLRSAGQPTSPMIATMITVVANSVDGLLPRRRARAPARARRRRRRLGDARHRGRQGAHPAVDGLRPRGVVGWSLPDSVRQWRAVIVPLFVLAAPPRRHRAVLDRRDVPLQRRLPAARRRGPGGGADRHDPRGRLHRRQHRPDERDDDARRTLGRSRRRRRRDGLGAARSPGPGSGRPRSSGCSSPPRCCSSTCSSGRPAETCATMAGVGILINAAFQVVKVRNMIVGAGVLPSANDVRGVIMGDVVGAFARRAAARRAPRAAHARSATSASSSRASSRSWPSWRSSPGGPSACRWNRLVGSSLPGAASAGRRRAPDASRSRSGSAGCTRARSGPARRVRVTQPTAPEAMPSPAPAAHVPTPRRGSPSRPPCRPTRAPVARRPRRRQREDDDLVGAPAGVLDDEARPDRWARSLVDR